MIENDVQPEVGEPLETFHIYPMGEGFFVRKEAAAETVVDSTPVKQQPRDNHDVIMMLVSSLIMTLFVILIPNTPISEQISITHSFTLSGDLQSHLLSPVTARQSITVAATGRGHADHR